MAEEVPEYDDGFSRRLADSFRDRVQYILRAEDERALYQWKGLHFEKLKGKRKHQRSIRLDKQFRLILEIELLPAAKVVALKGIEDYH